MNRLARLILLLGLLVAAPLHADPLPARLSLEITDAARVLRDASLAGEFETVVPLMHPRIVEKAGGPAATVAMLTDMMARMKDQGLEFERYDVGIPAELFESDGARHVFIPTATVVVSPGRRVERKGWLLASQAKSGGGWVFIDGGGVADAASLADMFPGFPLDVRVPEKDEIVGPR